LPAELLRDVRGQKKRAAHGRDDFVMEQMCQGFASLRIGCGTSDGSRNILVSGLAASFLCQQVPAGTNRFASRPENKFLALWCWK
jgi:hypothetical protein